MANSKIKFNAPSYISPISLPQNIDLDDYSMSGFYVWTYGDEGTAINCPTTKVFTMLVIKKSNSMGSNQILLDNNGHIYYRIHYSSTGWQAWREVTTTSIS